VTGTHTRSVEFEARIDGSGKITVPGSVAKEFRRTPGAVHVRLTTHAVGDELRERDVKEEEIERVSKVQLESREQVVTFLLSEGALRKSRMRRRAR
jgi:hypothetical protein